MALQVSRRAKIRGLPQLGTLGAGNHYAEIQVVEEVFDEQAAKKMGIDKVNQVRGMTCCGVTASTAECAATTEALLSMYVSASGCYGPLLLLCLLRNLCVAAELRRKLRAVVVC